MLQSPLRIGIALLLVIGHAHGQTAENNAGFGGIYRTVDLQGLTGNDAHLGCADLGGRTFVTARAPQQGGSHVIYVIDAAGTLVATLPQPAIHSVTAWGMRDLCTDGVNLAGGSEAGISIVTPTGALASSWNGRPIAQPITGPMLTALGVPRGLAWDSQAANGAGRFYAVNFASAIYEFDTVGNITGTFANAGWNGSGLALDPGSGNLWIDACPARGDIAEIDRSGGTWQPTGHRIPRARSGSFAGGLSEADPAAGVHAPWSCTFALVGVCQGARDTLAVQRVDLWPSVRGFDEVRLDTAVNGGPLDGSTKPCGTLDTLTLQLTDPSGVTNGHLGWTLFNFPPESGLDDLSDVSMFGVGTSIAPEQRTLNELGIAHPTPTLMTVVSQVGTPVSLYLAPGIPIPQGFLVRMQSVTLDVRAPFLIVSTNEAHWLGGTSQHGIIVEAEGPSSHAEDAQRGFWRIRHSGTGPAIANVRLDWASATLPGQATMVFDIDQDLGGRRHDAGNSTTPGCKGTWRNGSDVATGLDYAHAGNHRAACAIGSQNAGFTIDGGDAGAAVMLTYRFAGGLFTAGKCLEFDCDTDGGLGGSGDAMRGLVVTVTLVDNTTLSGTLAADPQIPLRAFVKL